MRNFIWLIRKNIADFISGSLENKGERVELIYTENIDFEKLDIYQKSHYRRYEFAKTHIIENGLSGDFACGTGYGSAMIAENSKLVIGADIDEKVINKISESTFPNIDGKLKSQNEIMSYLCQSGALTNAVRRYNGNSGQTDPT